LQKIVPETYQRACIFISRNGSAETNSEEVREYCIYIAVNHTHTQ
jgi:hypothetical protein